jgi:tRNA threonylcarbamoyl adenosine modification protein YjeE
MPAAPPATDRSARSNGEAETRSIAGELADELAAGDVVALLGPLGAGKTAFVRGLAERLGLAPDERVSSPSYTLVNEYLLAEPVRGAERLVHLDLYRLDGDDALEALGFSELSERAIVAIEWPEHAPEALAVATVRVEIAELPEAGGEAGREAAGAGRDARALTIRRTRPPGRPGPRADQGWPPGR